MLFIIAPRITNGQRLEIEGGMDPHGQAVLIARLHAMRADATVASSRVANWKINSSGCRSIPSHNEDYEALPASRRRSKQDASIIRQSLALAHWDAAKHWASKDLCPSFGDRCRHGRLNQGALYCSDCSVSGDTFTHGRLNQAALHRSDRWSVWEN